MRRTIILTIVLGMISSFPLLASGTQLIPLAVGNKWEYSLTQVGVMSISDGRGNAQSVGTESEGVCVEEVLSIKEVRPNGDTVYEYRSSTRTEAGINTEAEEQVEDSLVIAGKKGILVLASKVTVGSDLFTGEWEEYDPPLVMYDSGLAAGKKWKIGTIRQEDLRMPLEGYVHGRETVTVPAGTFTDCLKVYVTCSRLSGSMGFGEDKARVKSGKSVTVSWLAPGVGVVKEDTLLQAKMELSAEGITIELMGTHREIRELQPGYQVE